MNSVESSMPDEIKNRTPERRAAAVLYWSIILLWFPGILIGLEALLFLMFIATVLSLACIRASSEHLTLHVRCSIVVFACSSSLVLFDVSARGILKHILFYRPDEYYIRNIPEQPDLTIYKAGISTTWRIHGDLAAVSANSTARETRTAIFRSDAHGYRNFKEAGDGDYDGIILGDSFPMALGSSQPDGIIEILMAKTGLTFYNLAIPGTGPVQQSLHLERMLPKVRVSEDCIVLHFLYGGNDLEDSRQALASLRARASANPFTRGFRNLENYQKLSPVRMISGRLFLFANRVQTVFSGVTRDGTSVLFYEPHRTSMLRERSVVRASNSYRHLLEGILSSRNLSKEIGCQYQIILLPTKEEIYDWLWDSGRSPQDSYSPTGFTSSIMEECNSADIRCVDTGSEIRAAAAALYLQSGSLLWWRDDTHWNHAGHTLVAEIIGRVIKTPNANTRSEL